jgi:DNA-binding transcriptional LysR family regulator
LTDWALWHSFLAVCETGSLSAAAKRRGLTQPSLSRHIRDLEHQLGVTLFKRSVKGLEPTEIAMGFMAQATHMQKAAQQLDLMTRGQSSDLRGTVRLTASCVMSALILPPILTQIRREEPQILLELIASDVAQNLLYRDADIAIRMFDPTQGALKARKLADSPLGLYAAKSYVERRGMPTDALSYLTHDLIGQDRLEDYIKGMAAVGIKIGRDGFSFRCDDQIVNWHMLKAGAGIGVAQRLLGDAEPDLIRLELGVSLPSLPVWLVMHEGVGHNAHIRRVANILAQAITHRFGG